MLKRDHYTQPYNPRVMDRYARAIASHLGRQGCLHGLLNNNKFLVGELLHQLVGIALLDDENISVAESTVGP